MYSLTLVQCQGIKQMLREGHREAQVSTALGRKEVLGPSLDLEISGSTWTGAILRTVEVLSDTVRHTAARIQIFLTQHAAFARAS